MNILLTLIIFQITPLTIQINFYTLAPMAKMKRDTTRQLKEVKITAKKSTPKSVTSYGEVPTRKIDSVRKANPAAGRAIGKGYTGSGGMTTYGRDASDVIRKTVKKK